MATKAELERHLQNPNVRKMLDLIAYSEGVKHGYHTMFGNSRIGDLSRHPGVSKSFRQTDGKSNTTTAAGRYQFLKGTWNSLARKYGLSDFSPRSQDIAALALIAEKGQLQNVVKGNLREAVSKLGGVWASLPSSPYKQPKHSWATIDQFLTNGTWKGKSTTSSATPAPTAETTTDPFASVQLPQPTLDVQAYQPLQAQPVDLFGGADSGLFGTTFDLFTALQGLGYGQGQAQVAKPAQSNTQSLFSFM